MNADKIKSLFSKGPKTEESSESEDPRLSAAEDIIAAVKAGDAEALDVALADHYEQCQMSAEPDADDGIEE